MERQVIYCLCQDIRVVREVIQMQPGHTFPSISSNLCCGLTRRKLVTLFQMLLNLVMPDLKRICGKARNIFLFEKNEENSKKPEAVWLVSKQIPNS
jgi:hypothetical protein